LTIVPLGHPVYAVIAPSLTLTFTKALEAAGTSHTWLPSNTPPKNPALPSVTLPSPVYAVMRISFLNG
jgi:hypothetical protein